MSTGKSISSAMILILIVSLVLVMSIMGTLFFFINKSRVESRVAISSKQIADRLAYTLISPMWDMANTQIEFILNFEMKNRNLAGIIVVEKDQRIVSAATRIRKDGDSITYDTSVAGKLARIPQLKLFKQDIVKDNNKLGTLLLYISDREVRTTLSETMTMMFIQLVISAIAIALVVFFSLRKLVITPMQQLLAMLYDIEKGKGDLTRRIIINSNDEFGELARLFNSFIENIQKIIRDVINNSKTLSGSSESLLNTTNQFSTSAERMLQQSSSVASSAKMTTSRVDTIAESTSEMSKEMQSISTAIEEISISINEVAKNCQQESMIASKANDQAKSTQEIMEQLGDSAKHIGKIVVVINGIAEMTNLLALNASIEAARAGDMGKGFAVVANEVKELSKRTSASTLEISEQITEMQKNAENSINVIKSIGATIENINEISQSIVSAIEEQSATINEVASNITNASTAATRIADNVSETATGLSSVSSGVQEVSVDVESTMKNVQLMKVSCVELSNLSNEMRNLVGQFKI